MGGRATPSSIRSRASTRNAPTPAATDKISVILGTAGTWPASTWRSGSEMVMRKPSRKPITMMTPRLRLRVTAEPTRSPMGVMLASAPRVKNIMPTMIMAAPSRKHSRMLGEMGAALKHSASTMPTMGSTARSPSSSFSFNLGREPRKRPTSSLWQILHHYNCYPALYQKNGGMPTGYRKFLGSVTNSSKTAGKCGLRLFSAGYYGILNCKNLYSQPKPPDG